jgi:hypothetical protein
MPTHDPDPVSVQDPAADLLQQGMAALRTGERGRARTLLVAALKREPRNAQIWLWLAGAVDDPQHQRECLQRVLQIDPGCAAAQRGLASLAEPVVPPGQVSGPVAHVGRPAVTIWRRPRLAFERALMAGLHLDAWLIAAIAGIAFFLGWAAARRLGDVARVPEIAGLALLVGPLLGMVGLMLGGVLLRVGGRRLGGHAGAAAIRIVLGWSAAPLAVSLPLWGILLLLSPAVTFGPEPPSALVVLVLLVQAGLVGWAGGLSVIGLSSAHGFSVYRAAATWLAAAFEIVLACGLIFVGTALAIALRGG